jgi:hypothetical protein
MAHNLDISRHQELFEPHNFRTPITIIGAGATGSWIALSLAKLGIEDITVWDFDKVEAHNIPNQAYGIHDVDKPKVKALYELIQYETKTEINIKPQKYTNQRLSGIVIMQVDSMSERKRIWETSIKMKPSVKLLIETRLGMDCGRVYNVEPTNLEHIKKYEQTFYSDEESEVSACGHSLSVISSALGISAWCVRQLINFHNNVELDNEILIDFKYNNIIKWRWG